MKINNLKLTNFQGIKSFEFEPEGEDASIYGDNATGKTTVNSAFTWLLFGKNSLGVADFAIKTLDEKGEPIPGLNHEVEGVFELNGKTITLRRVYHKIWTKQRGSATKQFNSHTTDFYFDGVPVKKNEYEDRIASIIDEQTFRLLTDPRYFNEVLPWEKRREILIKAVGDVSDVDIIATDKSLVGLPEILDGHKLDDYKKIIAARKKAINSELDDIPKRIDEVKRGLPDAGGNLTPLSELKKLKEQRNTKSQELANLEAGGGIAEATKKLREIEAELIQIQKDCWLKNAEEVQTAKVELRKYQDKIDFLNAVIKGGQRLMLENKQEIQVLEENIKTLREEWHKTNAQVFTFKDTETCPTCGQTIPSEKVAETRQIALSAFNLRKANELERINNEGKRAKEKSETLRSEKAKIEQGITDHQSQLSELEQKIISSRAMIIELEAKSMYYENAPVYTEKQAQKLRIEGEIIQLNAGNTGAVEAIKQGIQSIDDQISQCETTIARISQREKGLARIEELDAQEKVLAAEFEKLERELFLMEKFTRTRVEMLTDKINTKFTLARFKMFNILVNGATEEMAETTYLGIPYASLNHGSQVNIGLDIIRTLQQFYNFHSTVWIDRRESVTKLIPMDCQIISLIVSERDKTLRIEKALTG